MIRDVRLTLARDRNDGAVVKVVVPDGIQSVAAGVERLHELDRLRLALGDENDWSAARRGSCTASDLADDVAARLVVDRLRGVEPQPVQVKLVDPVRGVRGEVVAHGSRIRTVEVQGVAPFILISVRVVRL